MQKNISRNKKSEAGLKADPVKRSIEENYLAFSTESFLNSFIIFMMFKAALRARAPAALLPFFILCLDLIYKLFHLNKNLSVKL